MRALYSLDKPRTRDFSELVNSRVSPTSIAQALNRTENDLKNEAILWDLVEVVQASRGYLPTNWMS